MASVGPPLLGLSAPAPCPAKASRGCARSRHWETMAYFASVAAFSIDAANSGACERKDRVAARKFKDLRLRSLRHESLEVRIDHSVLGGNYCVARLLFPSRNCGLSVKCFSCNRYLGYRHKTRDLLGSVCSEIIQKRIGVDCQKAVANRFDALVSRRHFVC